jgi:hypothetical protein
MLSLCYSRICMVSISSVDALARSFAASSSHLLTSVTPDVSGGVPAGAPLSPASPGTMCLTSMRAAHRPSVLDANVFTVCVGLKPSNAGYFLDSTEEVLRSLYGLVLRDQEEAGKRSPLSPRPIGDERSTPSGSPNREGVTKRMMGQRVASFSALTQALFGATSAAPSKKD